MMFIERSEQFWNKVLIAVYILYVYVLFVTLLRVTGEIPRSISIFDTLMLILATFRLIRLFVYDKMMLFLRDYFLVDTASVASVYNVRGLQKTISVLLGCPWCMGVWIAPVVAVSYFISPYAWLPLFILALSAVATVIQLTANYIGWSAEYKKKHVSEE